MTPVDSQKPLGSPFPIARAGLAHAEDAGHGPDPGEDHGHAGQPLHDPRQVVVDRREVDVERARDEVAVVVELVGDPDQVVVDVAEVDEVLGVDHRQLAVRQLVEHLPGRRGRSPDREELLLHREDLLERPLVRRFDDLVLEVVDLVGQLVHHREVAVDDPVGDRVEQEVGAFREDGADAVAHRHAPGEVGRRAVDREEELLAEHEVELRGLDFAAVLDVEQHDMDQVVVDRDLRPLVSLLDVVGDQRVQLERPRDGPDGLLGGVGQVDPEAGVGLGDQSRQRIEVARLRDARGRPADDPDRPRFARRVAATRRVVGWCPLRGRSWGVARRVHPAPARFPLPPAPVRGDRRSAYASGPRRQVRDRAGSRRS